MNSPFSQSPRVGAYRPLIISVALTGAIPSGEKFPTLPLSPREIVDDILQCAEAGASVFHVHTRDKNGNPLHSRELMQEIIGAVRSHDPNLVICATTSSRGADSLDDRLEIFRLGTDFLPDMASLTLGSYNTPHGVNINPHDEILAIADEMKRTGVRPEVEIFEPGMIDYFHWLRAADLVPRPAIANFILGVRGASPANALSLGQMVHLLGDSCEWAVGGVGFFQRPMTVLGSVMGGNLRVGMEDDPRGDFDGWQNVDAVRRAVNAAELVGREIETARGARARLGLG